MKIIAFYVGQYPEGFSPMSRRLHYYMKALHQKGVIVEIVMPSPHLKENGVYDGVHYSFVNAPVKSRFNGYKIDRIYASICGELSKRCNVLLVDGMSYGCLKRIPKMVHANGGKVVTEVNENPGSIRGRRLDTCLSLKIKRYIYLHRTVPNYDGFIVISHSLEELLNQFKNAKAVIARIPILSGTNQITSVYNPQPIDGIPYILHAGALNEQKDGVLAMLQGFAIAYKHFGGRLKFFFTYKKGFPKLMRQIDKIISENHLENAVQFLGILSNDELEKLRANSAMAIVNKPSNFQNDYNFPTKLSEILPARVPLIVTQTGELGFYFRDGENAFVVEANNVAQIAEKIIYIIEHPREVELVTARGQEMSNKEFYYGNYADQLCDFFETVYNK